MYNKRLFTVSQVNSYIHRVFESDYALKRIRLKGEVSNCKYHSSGHLYFSLKDERSQIRCVMFAGDVRRGLRFSLENGQSVIAGGSITVYEQAGSYQMVVRDIELSGAGDLYLRFEQLKQELFEKGYFDFDTKKPLPPYPEKIGVVTAVTGAAIRDIESTAKWRNPYVQLYLYPARVQGEGAAQSIAQGIKVLDQAGMDIIIIGRGGGSIEDLWAFNEITVANAIYQAVTPIISGTGHEIDMTIADYCADVRAATPTAACELAVPEWSAIEAQFDNILYDLRDALDRKIRKLETDLALFRSRLEARNPAYQIRERRIMLKNLAAALHQPVSGKLRERKQEYSECLLSLSALSPTNRLRGGYTFAQTNEGVPVVSAASLEEGDQLELVFSDGQAQVQVENVFMKAFD